MMKKTSKSQPKIRSRRKTGFQENQKNHFMIGLGFYAVLVIMAMTGDLSWQVVGWYALLGVVTYLAYATDKRAAMTGKWRTPETTLHILSTLGGWAGAMTAQQHLRHKTQKSEFRLTYYLTVIINLAGLFFIVAGDEFSLF